MLFAERVEILKNKEKAEELTAFLDSPVNFCIGEYLLENDHVIGISNLAKGVQRLMGPVQGDKWEQEFDKTATQIFGGEDDDDLTLTTLRSVLDASYGLQIQGLISIADNMDYSLSLRGRLVFEVSKKLLELEDPVLANVL